MFCISGISILYNGDCMNISYDYYKIFYYVAKYKSFTRAAEVLYLNQPNLTRAVKKLEKELETSLFIRTRRGVRLTESGQTLFEHISAAFEHIQAAEEAVSLNKSLENGVVSIGATEIALRCFLLPVLDKYHREYQGVRIRILNISSPQALKMLDSGLVDFAVVSTPFEADEKYTENYVSKFYEIPVCGKEIYPKFENKTVHIEELAKEPVISLGNKTSTYDFYLNLFSRHKCGFSPDIEAATADQILPLVKHNLGIGFVPEEFLSEDSGVYIISLEPPVPPRFISMVKKKHQSLSLPAKELEKMLLSNKKADV